MNMLTTIAQILSMLIVLLRQQSVPKPILDTLAVLATTLEQSDDLSEDLQELRAQVEAMAHQQRDPTIAEYDALSQRANTAMNAIRTLTTLQPESKES